MAELGITERARPVAPAPSFSGTGMKMAELAFAQGAIYAFPLIFAVVCARNLGAANYGVVSFYTALTSFLCMFIEFGLDSIGVREVHSGRWRADPEQVVWTVTAAKLLTCMLTCAIALPLLLALRRPAEAALAYATGAYLVAFAFDTSWYLRSQEATRSVLFVAGVSRVAGIVLLVAVVTGGTDTAQAMWTYAFVAWANAVVGWLLLHRLHLFRRPRIHAGHLVSLFRSGSAIVLGNLSGSSLTNGGVAVLGVLADPLVTGAANMALRIRTAGQAALLPLAQLGFVRLSALAGWNRTGVVALGRRLFCAQMAMSSAIALVIILEADWIAALAYGLPQAPEAAGMLVRLVAVGIPAAVAGNLFGLQSLTLFKQERAYVAILLMASFIFFALLLSAGGDMAARWGWALVAAEAWVVLAAGLYLRRVVRQP